MHDRSTVVSSRETSLLATNVVLRRTYFLLSLTLMFSAACAYFSMISNAQPGILMVIIGCYGLLFLTQALRNSVMGIVSCFAFTGFMGYTLGPILNMYISGFSNGGQIVSTALGATGLIFLSLSAYVLTTRKDFSYMGGFLFCGMMVLFIGMMANMFMQIPMLSLMISGGFAFISSGLILFQTSQIINGGERNFIMATISLYVSIYNLFVSLLQIFGALSGRD